MLLKASLIGEKGEMVEQVAFTDVAVNAKIDRDMVKPSWAQLPPDWQVKQMSSGEFNSNATGWTVSKLPPALPRSRKAIASGKASRSRSRSSCFSDGLDRR